jgi:membrane protease subunit HflK
MPDNITPLKTPESLKLLLAKLSFLPFFLLFLVIVVPTMFYSVEPEQDAVVLRFGKYNRTEGPGLHFKLPNFPPFLDIENVVKVPVRKIHKLEIGFTTIHADVQSQYERTEEDHHESLMLTGDLNVADVEWIVQFQISNAREFLFNVRNVPENLHDISLAVMREVVGDKSVSEVLTTGRLDIESEAMVMMQKILDNYKMGINLVALKLQDVNPPAPVKPSFNEVNSAKQEAEQYVNEAWKGYNKVIPEARGKSDQTVADAQAYKQDLVNHAEGDSKRFASLYEEYKKAPDITKKRLYFEKMRDVMRRAKAVFVVDPTVKSLVPVLNMSAMEKTQ